MTLSQLSYLTDKGDCDMVRIWKLFWNTFHIWAPINPTVCSRRYGAHLEAHFSVISLIVEIYIRHNAKAHY
jgi:hypothetical protein